jgi:glutathione S-transferase
VLTLHTFPGVWGLTSVSPFCTKLETWLRLAGLDYAAKAFNPRTSPKGKAPYVHLDGAYLADSQLVLERLTVERGVRLDAGLTEAERSRGHALRRMLEEGTYFALCYERWQREEGWATYRRAFRALFPPGLRAVLPTVIRRDMLRALKAQGTGRHAYDVVQAMLRADMGALAAELGDKAFLFGAAPCSFDAVAFAFVEGLAGFPVESEARTFVTSHPALSAYLERMRARCFAKGPALGRLAVG